jgi:hypothetical protein
MKLRILLNSIYKYNFYFTENALRLRCQIYDDGILIKLLTFWILTNQNLIQEGIKRRLNSGNACYHSVQNLLSSRLLSKT